MPREAVRGALLVDGTGGEPRPGTTVIWEEEQIGWVGPDGDADLGDAEVVEADGDALLPGLIDCHVHVTLDGTAAGVDRVARDPAPLVAIRAAENARTLLQKGITTARDCGSARGIAIQAAGAQRSGELQATRLLAAGRGITQTGGHGWMIGVEADGADGVRKAVRTEIAAGADFIKLFVTGGVLGSGAHGMRAMMTIPEIEAAVDEAHRHGRKVAAHIHGSEGVELALRSGVDTIEHGTALTPEQAARMAEAAVALVPTLAAGAVFEGRGDELPADVRVRMEEVRSLQGDSVRAAIEAGVRVLPGTDAGTPFNPPGNLPLEMGLLADLGLGTAGVIRAATSLAAETLGLEGLGRIVPGGIADLVLVSGDPLQDLDVLRHPRLVIQAGRPV